MSAHTPGPWKAHKRAEPIGFAEWEIHWSDIGECVAEVVHEEGNALLIAAAPDLLSELQMLCNIVEAYCPDLHVSVEARIAFARAAIQKATGSATP